MVSTFPGEIMALLDERADLLDQDLRKILVQSLILLRNKGILSPTA